MSGPPQTQQAAGIVWVDVVAYKSHLPPVVALRCAPQRGCGVVSHKWRPPCMINAQGRGRPLQPLAAFFFWCFCAGAAAAAAAAAAGAACHRAQGVK